MITNEVGSKTIKSFTCLRCSTLDKKNQLRFQDAQATENAQTVHLAFLSMSTKKALQPYTKLAFIPLTELPVKSISMQILQLASNVVERVGSITHGNEIALLCSWQRQVTAIFPAWLQTLCQLY